MAVEAPEAAPSVSDIFAQAAVAGFGADAATKSGIGSEPSSGAGEPTTKPTPSEAPAKSLGDLEVEKQKLEQQPEATKPEPTEEHQEGEPTNLDEKGRYKWGELKKEVKTQKARIAELEAQSKQYETSSRELQDLKSQKEALEKQIQEANGELYLHRVEATPEWKKTITEPFGELSRSVDELATLTKADGNQIMEAVIRASRGDREALTTLTEGWQDWEKTDVRDLVKNMVSLNRRAEDLRKDSKQAYETSMRNQQELTVRQQQEQQKAFQQAASRAGDAFKSKLDGLLPDSDKLDYARIALDAEKGMAGRSPEEQAFAIYASNAVLGLHKLAESQKATIKSQEAELAKFRNGAPKVSPGTSPASPQEAAKPQTRDEMAGTSWENFAKGLMAGVGR